MSTRFGLARRLEVHCPGDALITINDRATTAQGEVRFFDLPLPRDKGRTLKYTVQGFIKRGGHWLTFDPLKGKPADFEKNPNLARTYAVSQTSADPDISTPLVFRNDERPKPEPETPSTGVALGLPLSMAVVAAAAVTALPSPTATVSFLPIDNTEKYRSKVAAFGTDDLKSSPIVPIVVKYGDNDPGVASVTRADARITSLKLKFTGLLEGTPDESTMSPAISFNLFLQPAFDGGTPKGASESGTVARKPKFDEHWTATVDFVAAEEQKDATLWDALVQVITTSVKQYDSASYLVVQASLDFGLADKSKTPVKNYVILWIVNAP